MSEPVRAGRGHYVWVVLIVLAGIAASVLLWQPRVAGKPLSVQEKVWPVIAQTVELREYAPEITLLGQLQSQRHSRISSAVTGVIKSVKVRPGDHVKAGALLVTVDPAELEAVVAERRAAVAQVQAQLDSELIAYEANQVALLHEQQLYELSHQQLARQQQLQRQSLAARAQLDAAQERWQRQALALNERQRAVADYAHRKAQLEAELAQAQARLKQAQLELQRTRIRAPFAGRIVQVAVNEGERLRSGDLVLEMYDSARLEVRTQAPLRYLPQLRSALANGQTLHAEALIDGTPVALTLTRLAARSEAGQAGLDAFFQLTRPIPLLETGRIVQLKLTLAPEPAVAAVPLSALYDDNRIYRIEGERLQSLTVERIGERRDRDGQLLALVRAAELNSGDQVLVQQLPGAINGLKVAVRPLRADAVLSARTDEVR